MLLHLDVSTAHHPPYLISGSVRGSRKKRQAVVHCLPDQDILCSKSGKRAERHSAAEKKLVSAVCLKCLSTAKFGLLIFSNSCCSFIGINKINQTAMTHPRQIMCNLDSDLDEIIYPKLDIPS